MTKIKLCGMTRPEDIEEVNRLRPDLVGLVFWKKSKRYIDPKAAAELKSRLDPGIACVGVFIDEELSAVADLLTKGIIDMAQLHGSEDDAYIRELKEQSKKPVIKAFRMNRVEDPSVIRDCAADMILLDSGAGTGKTFDWSTIPDLGRPYFLAGGLYPDTVAEAVKVLRPYGVDVSSGIETDGKKDKNKMAAFVTAVREEDKL